MTPRDYEAAVAEFNEHRRRSFPDDPTKNYISHEGWLKLDLSNGAQGTAAEGYRKILEFMWNSWDIDGNGELTVCN